MSAIKGNVHEVESTQELDVLLEEAKKKNMLLVLDTYATWCGPCKMISPFVEGLSMNPEYNKWVAFAKADIEIAEDIAIELQVKSMPTFYLFHNGKVVTQFSGANTQKLTQMLIDNRYLIQT